MKAYSTVCKVCDNIATFKGVCAIHRPYAVLARECAEDIREACKKERIGRYEYQMFRTLELYQELSPEAKEGICFLCAALLMNANKRDAKREPNQGVANLGPLAALEIVFGLVEAQYL